MLDRSIKQIDREIKKNKIRAMATRDPEARRKLLAEAEGMTAFRKLIARREIEAAAFVKADHMARILPEPIEAI